MGHTSGKLFVTATLKNGNVDTDVVYWKITVNFIYAAIMAQNSDRKAVLEGRALVFSLT